MASTTPKPRQPQDRKPKDGPIEFVGTDGTTYRMPAASEGIMALPTRAYRDAIRAKDTDALVDLVFQVIDASPDTEMGQAFYDLPLSESTKLVNRWLTQIHDGASLPQS